MSLDDSRHSDGNHLCAEGITGKLASRRSDTRPRHYPRIGYLHSSGKSFQPAGYECIDYDDAIGLHRLSYAPDYVGAFDSGLTENTRRQCTELTEPER